MGQTHRSGGFASGTCDRRGSHFRRVAKGQRYKYCSVECSVEPVADRILKRLQSDGEPGSCLLWTGKKHCDGYGEIQHDGRVWKVHRLMWTLTTGEIPDDLEVCHKCDNPACVRLDHLFLGTHTENMRDMASKGRGVTPDVRGERHGAAKITTAQALAIFNDPRTQTEIAADYCIAQSLVSQIKRKKVWKHIHEAAA